MYEYRYIRYQSGKVEDGMNQMAASGWRVVCVTPDIAMGSGVWVTYERLKK